MTDGDDKEEQMMKATDFSQSPPEDFDDVLVSIGSKGKYQKWLLYAFLCPLVAIVPFFGYNLIFMLYEPDHWCHVPGRPMDSMDLDTWKNMTLPRETGADGHERFSQCFMYNSSLSSNSDLTQSKVKVKCQHGWEYDRTDYDVTIPSQFDWVCDKSHYATNVYTMIVIGSGIGSIIFGPAADRYGRKPMFILTSVMHLIFRTISLFVAHNYLAFLALHVLIGASLPMVSLGPTLIVVEGCDKDFRGWVYSLTWVAFVIGFAGIPFLAWVSRTWLTLGIITTVPGFFLLLYVIWVPESPRWLVSKGRVKEASKILLKMAKVNDPEVKLDQAHLESRLKAVVRHQNIVGQKEDNGEEKWWKRKKGFWTLLTKRRLAKHTILLTLLGIIEGLIYEGITLNSTRLSGNQFINFFILAIIEVPSVFLGGYLVDKTGRRLTQLIFLFMTSLTCLGTTAACYFTPNEAAIVMPMIVTAKFSINSALLVSCIQSTELFPTELRSTGFAFSSTVGFIFGTTGPYLVYLGKINIALPYLILTILAGLGAIASTFLPETLHQKLPETAHDANAFGANQKYWNFKPPPPSSSSGDKMEDSSKVETIPI